MPTAKKKASSNSSSKTPGATPPQFLFGFKDAQEKVKIQPAFEMVGEFDRGHDNAKAKKDGKWGVISKSGQWVCEPGFELIGKVYQNHFTFREGNRWGLCDVNGDEISKAEFDEII